MKRKGFTLAEVLIAVGIIGVMAALMATAFNHAKPDSTKMMYLKAYDSLNQAVQAMMSDTELYHQTYTPVNNGITYNVDDYPLLDLSAPSDSDFSSFSGSTKFGKILARLFKGEHITSNGSTVTFKSGPADFNWTIAQGGNGLPTTAPASLPAAINNGIYNEIQLTFNDKTFNFCVQPNGEISAIDAQGRTYLRNRRNVRSRNDSLADAGTACSSNTYYIYPAQNGVYTIAESSTINTAVSNQTNPVEPGNGCSSDPCNCATSTYNYACDEYKTCLESGGTWTSEGCVKLTSEDDAKKYCIEHGGSWNGTSCDYGNNNDNNDSIFTSDKDKTSKYSNKN